MEAETTHRMDVIRSFLLITVSLPLITSTAVPVITAEDCPPMNPMADCYYKQDPFATPETPGCFNDDDCDRAQKCCPMACKAPQCQVSVSGGGWYVECPTVGRSDCTSSANPCSSIYSTSDCSGGLVCCPTTCGDTRCVNGTWIKIVEICPLRTNEDCNVPGQPCDEDIDCAGYLKCCQTNCGDARCIFAGYNMECPYYDAPFLCSPGQNPYCHSVMGCTGMMVCCDTGSCDGYCLLNGMPPNNSSLSPSTQEYATSTTAIPDSTVKFGSTLVISDGGIPGSTVIPGNQVKSGNCPADRVGKKEKSDVSCSIDSDCKNKQKCCSKAGQMVCRKPDSLNKGTCPVAEQKNQKKVAKSACDSDNDCSNTQKCCPTKNGGYACQTI